MQICNNCIVKFVLIFLTTLNLLASENVKFEQNRKLCILNFSNRTNLSELDYLSNGISSILYSKLKFIYYIYDKKPLVSWRKISSKKQNFDKIDALNIQKNSRFIPLKHQLYQKNKNSLNFAQIYDFSRENDCFYVLQGFYELEDRQTIKIRSEIFSIKNNQFQQFSYSTSLLRVYQNLQPLILDIRKFLAQKKEFEIEINTKENNAFVFINDNFVGKTPAKIRLFKGKYQLRIFKQNFVELKTFLEINSKKKFFFTLNNITREGFLSIKSSPSQAKVYLGTHYIGKTPLKNQKVKVGWSQISLEKKGYRTYYRGVEIKKKQTTEIFAQMQEGKTIDYIQDKYVFLDYSYADFSLYSLLSIPVFYTSYLHYNTKARQLQDKIFSRSLLYNLNYINNLQDFNQNQTRLLYFYEIQQRKKAQKKLKNYLRNSGDVSNQEYGFSVYGMGLMLGLSFWFYQKSFDSTFSDFAFFTDKTGNSHLSFQFYFRF